MGSAFGQGDAIQGAREIGLIGGRETGGTKRRKGGNGELEKRQHRGRRARKRS